MTRPNPSKDATRQAVPLMLAVTFTAAACSSAIAGSLPAELLQQLASRIRNPEDFTPERYHRYTQLCGFFAGAFAICAYGCVRRRTTLSQYATELRRECQSVRARLAEYVGSIPHTVWCLFLVGAAVRLWFLRLPMAYDESYSFLNFASRPVYLAIADYNSTNNHLFNTFMMHWMYQIFGQTDWALRIPVLCFGIALVPAAWFWARERWSDSAAMIATALIAVSPILVSYSVNARGYLYITTCAVVLDWALLRVSAQPQRSAIWWIVAWCATVVGCWSMPLMVYPASATIAGFLLSPLVMRQSVRETFGRVIALIPFGLLATIAIVAFYGPSWIFRGLQFLEDPIVEKVGFSGWLAKLPGVLAAGAGGWLAVPSVIQWIALGLMLAGAIPVISSRSKLLLLLPFIIAVLLVTIQRVSPPPRIFLYLAPWAALLCGIGTEILTQRLAGSSAVMKSVGLAIVTAGTLYLLGRSYLFDEKERVDYASVPHVVARLQTELETDEPAVHRLIAPLPCDLPSIYYMRQRGFTMPVNGTPHRNETLWLITRKGQTPTDTLQSPLVNLPGRNDHWEPIAKFKTLVLYRAVK